MAKFFSWDPERDGFELYETAEAARESAEGAIDWYLDDEWDESVEGVCWGEVLGDVTQTITGDCDCPLDDDGTSPHAHHCRYEIEDVENSTADDLRSQLAAANKRTDKLKARRAADHEAIANAEMTLAELAAAKQENERLMELLTGIRRRWESRRKHWRDNAGDFARGAEQQIGYVVGEIDDVLAACEEKS